MQRPPPGRRYLDAMAALFGFALVLLLPPVLTLWATESAGWLLPYAVWGGLIAVAALIGTLRRQAPASRARTGQASPR